MSRLILKICYIKSDKSSDYMKYIAMRPRVEKHGEHGLFSGMDSVNLSQALKEVNSHRGRVWTLIYSLRREDAARLGYDNAESWRSLIKAHSHELADELHIPQDMFRWYGAYHDEGSHPHIHLMVWSTDPRKGFLTKDGINHMRSLLTNDIFENEMHELYVRKDIAYKELTSAAQDTMRQLTQQMSEHLHTNPVIEQKMLELISALEHTPGKKQYGYLNKSCKELVNAIVDALEQEEDVAKCYQAWADTKDELNAFYHSKPPEHIPLSQRKEFRSIKNMIIAEAERIRLGTPTFEDEQMDDEPESDPEEHTSQYTEYLNAKRTLTSRTALMDEKSKARIALEQLAQDGFSMAAYLLGKLYRDGIELYQDPESAKDWFQQAAEAGYAPAQYALGKMLLEDDPDTAVKWLEQSADQGNSFAMYQMGKLYLTGNHVRKNRRKALASLTVSANLGNQFAQYTLGKLYLQGKIVQQDKDTARTWFAKAAAQDNPYAQLFLDHMDERDNTETLLSTARLLQDLCGVFRTSAHHTSNPNGIRIDSKRRRRLMEKRMAMGHKWDDHVILSNQQLFK